MSPFASRGWRAVLHAMVASICAWQPEPVVAQATAERPVLDDRYPPRRSAFPGGVTGLADVVYATRVGFRPLTLDLYVPAHPARSRPALVFVHGGGWLGGHSRHAGAFMDWPRVLASVASRGYVVASVNYRLSSEAPAPAAAQDVESSIAWLREHARDFDIAGDRIGAWGASAGGQLAALAGTACPDCVQAVAAWYGVFDFAPLIRSPVAPNVARYLGCVEGACTEQSARIASPIAFVDARDPPFLLVHGTVDQTVAVEQSKRFHAVLRGAGVSSELLLLDGVDHSFIGQTSESTRAASLRALEATIVSFDCRLLKKRCRPPSN
jgi:acetyl esterase/lipase